MYKKEIKITKTSCKGKVFECTKIMMVYDDEEKRERRQEYNRRRYEEIKAERERLERIERALYEKATNPTTMDQIIESYEEYVKNIKDFEY